MKDSSNADTIQTVLVPTDFSKEAQNAFLYAIEMARTTKAEIVLFHAFHHPVFSPSPYNEEEKKVELEEEKLKKLQEHTSKAIQGICKDFSVDYSSADGTAAALSSGFCTFSLTEDTPEAGKIKITCACVFGLIAEEILNATRRYGADIVVMGMRGAGAISQVLLGSTTMAIIEQSEVPVLAVPAKRQFEGLKTIVAAIDLSKLPDLHTLDPLKTIAHTFKSHLHVLHLYKQDTQQEERNKASGSLDALDACMSEINHDVHFKQTDDVPKGIHDYVEDLQADLLALLPSQHTFLSRLLSKSITGEMAAKATIPLLALPTTAAGAKPPQG